MGPLGKSARDSSASPKWIQVSFHSTEIGRARKLLAERVGVRQQGLTKSLQLSG